MGTLACMARPRKFDEQDVLTAARDTFWRGGYKATSVQDLAEATGLGAQSLYGAFGSKRDLFMRISTSTARPRLPASKPRSPPTPVRGTGSLPQWCSKTTAAWIAAPRLPDGQQHRGAQCSGRRRASACVPRVRRHARAVRAADHRGPEKGEIDSDVDPTETARALIAVMQGIEFLQKSGIAEDEVRRLKHAALDMIERSVTKTVDSEELQP